jgi:hypothetical protein
MWRNGVVRHTGSVWAAACALALAVPSIGEAAAGSNPTNSIAATPISGMSPYPDGGDPNDPLAVTECNGGPQQGTLYRNSETEPHLAVNPTDPDNMIAAWHQDRWSNGAAQGVMAAYTKDGGATWTHVMVPFTNCAGAEPGDAVAYERASDPWISFGADGAAYFMALVADNSMRSNGMAVAKSLDGGATWTEPIPIAANPARGAKSRSLFHDKNTITADPHDPDNVYATWNIFRNGAIHQVFSRSRDGGHTWSPARPVNKKEVVGKHTGVDFRQGAQIVVLPDGTLLNVFYRALSDPRGRGGRFLGIEQAIYRSYNQGKHWERLDTPISNVVPTGGFDVELGIFVRDGGTLPEIAVDRQSGDVYVVWQDGRNSIFGASSVLISKSSDGGDTWSDPIAVTDISNPGNQSFLPAVAVAADGTVGVLYYDFRNDRFGDAVLTTDVHLVMLDSDLNILGEQRLTDTSFDMRQMAIARGYFPGDYVGLAAAGNDFVAAFTVANNLGLPVVFPSDTGVHVDSHNRQDIVFARVSRPASSGAPGTAPSPARDGIDTAASNASRTQSGRPVLHANTPNPFNPVTTIAFELSRPSNVSIEIVDIAGRRVQTLLAGAPYTIGQHRITWNGRSERGVPVASGVYLYRLHVGDFVETRRMTLLR